MPIIKSAKKALRQSLKRRKANIKKKEAVKKTAKEIKTLFAGNKKEEALKLLPQAYKLIDKAAKTGILKKNTAGRRKSQLAKLFKVSK